MNQQEMKCQDRKLQLAGIRHLNRLEYAPVAEWNDAHD